MATGPQPLQSTQEAKEVNLITSLAESAKNAKDAVTNKLHEASEYLHKEADRTYEVNQAVTNDPNAPMGDRIPSGTTTNALAKGDGSKYEAKPEYYPNNPSRDNQNTCPIQQKVPETAVNPNDVPPFKLSEAVEYVQHQVDAREPVAQANQELNKAIWDTNAPIGEKIVALEIDKHKAIGNAAIAAERQEALEHAPNKHHLAKQVATGATSVKAAAVEKLHEASEFLHGNGDPTGATVRYVEMPPAKL